MRERDMIQAYKERLRQVDAAISGMVCLGLLEMGSPRAVAQVIALTAGLSARQFSSLFFLPSNLDKSTRHRVLFTSRRGWIVAGFVRVPRRDRIKRSSDGVCVVYSADDCIQAPLIAYHDTLEGALHRLTQEAAGELGVSLCQSQAGGARSGKSFHGTSSCACATARRRGAGVMHRRGGVATSAVMVPASS